VEPDVHEGVEGSDAQDPQGNEGLPRPPQQRPLFLQARIRQGKQHGERPDPPPERHPHRGDPRAHGAAEDEVSGPEQGRQGEEDVRRGGDVAVHGAHYPTPAPIT
jgi:hypothetical protein